MRHQQQLAHRFEVAHRVELRFLIHIGRNGVHGLDAKKQGVTIRCAGAGRLRADHAARAWSVVDHHRLAQRLAEFVTHQTRDHIGRNASGKGHDHFDGAAGVARALRPSGGHGDRGCTGGCGG